MPIVRQLPQVYLRGALANETMKNLTKEEKTRVEELFEMVIAIPEIASMRFNWNNALNRTIKADYRDQAISQADFHVAVWRACVQLLYHRHYTFQCTLCSATDYLAQNNRRIAISHRGQRCQACNKCIITVPGSTDYEVGQAVDFNDLLALCDKLGFLQLQQYNDKSRCHQPISWPESKSPIVALLGELRYPNSAEIIADLQQLKKFSTEMVFNYLRQILLENKRATSSRKINKHLGPADEIIREELLELCRRHKVKAKRFKQIIDGYHVISIQTLKTPPTFSAEYCELVAKAASLDVVVVSTANDIKIRAVASAPLVEGYYSTQEHVLVQLTDDEGVDVISQIQTRMRKGAPVDQDNPIAHFEAQDVLEAVKSCLPEGHCLEIFEILSQQGDAYLRYSRPKPPVNEPFDPELHGFGDTAPTLSSLAEYLGTTTSNVKKAKEKIRHIFLANEVASE